jgi:cytoskeleton protein RodZ
VPEIGATLREARMRERIDVSEIEAQTKIRAKYLRALENEEWGLLPGPTFVKSFLRTYAQALGLDGKALVEEYRLHHERPSEGMLEPIVSSSSRSNSGRSGTGRRRQAPSGPSRGYLLAVGTIVTIIVVLIVLLVTGGSSKNKGSTTSTTTTNAQTGHKAKPRHAKKSTPAGSGEVALSLTPTASIYVCLIGDGGHKLIPGLELKAGESTSTYHAKRFELTLGNNSVTLYIDGHPRPVPASSQAIGYSITKVRGRHTLSSAQQPTCK